MPNDKQWQRRTDEWVKASHESRKRKEAERRQRNSGQSTHADKR